VQEVQNTTANQSETEVVIKKAPSDHTDTELISTQYTPLFASLQAKMNMPTVVAPIVSVGQKFVPGPQHVPTSDIPKPAIDPYREMPL
jgi:hypothetical protein